MTLFVKGGRYVYLAHPPKTGGTSVTRMLKDAGWKAGWYLDRTPARNHPAHWTAREYQRALDGSTIDPYPYIHLLVRHPERRMESWYRYLHRIGDGLPDFDAWVNGMIDRSTPRQVDYIPTGRPYGVTALERGGPALAVKCIDPAAHVPVRRNAAGTPDFPTPITAGTRDRLIDYFAADYREFGYDH